MTTESLQSTYKTVPVQTRRPAFNKEADRQKIVENNDINIQAKPEANLHYRLIIRFKK